MRVNSEVRSRTVKETFALFVISTCLYECFANIIDVFLFETFGIGNHFVFGRLEFVIKVSRFIGKFRVSGINRIVYVLGKNLVHLFFLFIGTAIAVVVIAARGET